MRVVDEKTLDEFRQPAECELCLCRVGRREPHHAFARGMGGAGRIDARFNLCGLCLICHQEVHNGQVSREHVLGVIAAREGTTPEAIREAIHLLLRLPKDARLGRIAEEMAEVSAEAKRLVSWVLGDLLKGAA